MKNLVLKLARPKVMISTFLLFIIICALANTILHQDFTYLTQSLNYSSDYAYQLLNTIGENGRSAHMLIFIPDVIMVLLYLCFLIGANYFFFHSWIKNCKILYIITFIPAVLAIMQIGEIAALLIMITRYKDEFRSIAHVANTFTILKINLTVISFILPIIGFCGKMIVSLAQKRMKNSEQ